MKVNLVKELENSLTKRKKQDEKNDVLNEVKGILEYDTLEDMRILRGIGGNSTFIQSEKERAKVLEIEKKEQFYSGKVFTLEQIIKLGVKYRLKFLNSQHYTGYIPPSVIPEIKEMQRNMANQMNMERAKRENLTLEEYLEKSKNNYRQAIDDNDLKRNFYILAPASMFALEKTKSFSIKSKDPVMFYTDDNEHFRLIKKWGSDFTIFRRVLGWITKSTLRHNFIWAALFLAITLILSITIHWFILPATIGASILIYVFFDLYQLKRVSDFVGKDYVTSTRKFYI